MKKLYGYFQQGGSPLSSSDRLLGKNTLALTKHLVVLVVLVLMSSGVWGQTTDTYNTPGTTTYTVPAGVTSITVKCWGAGGGGGGSDTNNNNNGGSGGGGGGYATETYPVSPGDVISYTVGTGGSAGVAAAGTGVDGTSSTVLGLTANGGTGGAGNTGAVGVGGTAAGGTTNTSGGNGVVGGANGGNGGDGGNAASTGGAGGSNSIGGNGTIPGGGGGGGERANSGGSRNRAGGAGANGQVSFTYTVATVYYSKGSGTGVATTLANWTRNADGTGGTPTNFTSNNQMFVVQNSHTMTIPSGGWVVSGTNTSVVVKSGGTLACTGNLTGANCIFILSSGGALATANAAGITTTGATGSIQVTGTRTYNTGASYVYNGSSTQVTGTGLTQNTPANLTINNSAGVTLSATTTISGLLTMTNGALDMANTNLTVGSLTGSGNLTHTSGTAGNRTLTIGSDGTSTSYSGVISNGTATSTIVTKTGSGTLTLSGANTYSGATTIGAGTLKLNNASALGTTANGTSITSGAVLDLNGINYASAEALTVNGTGITSGGAVINSSATGATYGGLITLGSTSSIVGGTGAINISNAGTITGATFGLTLGGAQGGTLTSILGTTSGTLTKIDVGTWTLSGTNTYTGVTTVSAGTLKLNNTAALGTTANGTTITSGAVLDLNGINYASPEALTVNGTGIASGGAVINSSATGATYGGAITLASTSSIGTTGNITLGSAGITGTQNLTKVGAGSLSLGSGTSTLNSLTISAGTIVATSGSLNIAGDFTNSGTFTHNSGTVVFNKAGSQNIGTATFNNLTISGGGAKTLTGIVNVDGALTMTNGVLSLAAYDLTLGTASTLSGTYSDTNMIATDAAGKLIKQGNNAADFNLTYPVGTGSNYNGMVLTGFNATVTAPGTITVKAVANWAANTTTTDLKKYWVVTTSNLTGITTNISFSYAASDVQGYAASYALKYSPTDPATTWAVPNNASAAGVNPMTTSGGSDLAGTWTARETTTTYYSLRSGNWNDPTIWTLDPAGSLPTNPSTYPQTLADNAVIKNGRDVTMNLNTITCNSVTVEGTLDLASTTGHTFNTLRGNGRIEMSADNWPTITDASHFITEGQGEGTVAFYGNNFSLATGRTFYNMEVMMTSGQKLSLMSNYTLNGNLEVKTGTLRINDDNVLSTVKKTLTVNKDISVSSGAFFTVGTADVAGTAYNDYHDVICYGNFTNDGTVQFTNLGVPTYNVLATNGGVNLIFKGGSDNTFACNNTTNLYRMDVDKGTDQTYVLNLSVSADKNFRLFAANNTGSAQAKALYIANGTLRLTGTLFIPSLTEDGADYYIPTTGCLWLDSPGARVNTTAISNGETIIDGITSTGVVAAGGAQSFSIYGKFRITNGTLKTQSHGFVVWAGYNAIIQVDGGTVETPGLRSATVSTGKYSYIQNGGTVKMSGDIGSDGLEDYSATFSLKGSDNVFVMTGGELEIQDANRVTAVGYDRAFEVYSGAGNYNVTGGTIRINKHASGGGDFYVYSTVPFGNFEVASQNTSVANVYLESNLTVLNNVSVTNYSTLDVTANNYNLSIGGNLTTGATSSTYNARTNTTTFTGASNSTITNASASAIAFNNLIVSKDVNTAQLGLGGANSFSVAGNFTITKGVLATSTYTPTVAGNITITDGAITNSTGGQIVLNKSTGANDATTAQTLSGSGLVFGSVTINNSNRGVKLLSDIIVADLAFTNDANTAKVNIDTYNLTVKGAISNNSITNRWIFGAGNASDGGLTMYVNGDGAKTYPIGYDASNYTPAIMTVSGYSDDGYVTIVPANEKLATAASNTDQLNYHWKVSHSGFTVLPSVTYVFRYKEASKGGNDANYIPGKVLDSSPYTRTPVGNATKVDETNNDIDFSPAFTLEKANYTAGAASCFAGTVRTFYTRDNGSDAATVSWNDNNTWTFAPNDIDANGQVDDYEKHDSRQPAAGAYPVAGDVAVIGWVPWTDTNRAADQRGMPHGVNVNNRTEACAEVVFSQMKDASGNPTARRYRYNFQFRPTLCMNNGSAQLNTGMVRGEGMFWNRYSDPNFASMDIGEFAAQDSSYILYENTSGSISNLPNISPNLLIATNSWGGDDQDVTLNKSVVTNGNFEILGDANIVLPAGVEVNITVGRDLYMYERGSGGGARIDFANSGTNRTVTVGRDLIMANNGALISVVSPNTAGPQDHSLIVKRDIKQRTISGGGLQLWTANNQDRINLYLNGTDNMVYNLTNGAIPTLYRLYVNKGNSIATTATFNGDFDLNGPTSGAGITKALVLTNGLFVMSNASTAFTLTSGDDYFTIPSTAGLEIKAGTVSATGAVNASGIELDGLLKISGGTLDMAGADNPIVFGAGGAASINVSNGTLTVGGQIRRATNSDVGILQYYQSGGSVYVGRTTTGATTRGTLEVMGTGSVFSITGGDLYIERAASASIPGLYLMSETTSLASTNTIHIGSASVGGQTVGIYSLPTLQNLDVLNNSTAKILTVPLTLSGNLSITNGTFNANSLALNIGGNFANNGTFTSGNNTTTFNGNSAQAISGSSFTTFNKLVVANADVLTTNKAITVNDDFTVNSGSKINDNSNVITVNGDVDIDGTHEYGGAGKGLLMTNATLAQSISGDGVVGMLTINNTKGVDVPIGNSLSITNSLRLEAGVFNIDKNLLSLGESCTVVAGNPFSATNMIQTNVSFTDNGVKKIFPSGGSGVFTYPVGSGGKYTPVVFNISANDNNTGGITVKPAAEFHPSIQEDSESPSTEIVDNSNVLQYYWTVLSDGISGFNATATMTYDATDVRVTSGNVEADYIAARLLRDGSGLWNKPYGTIDAGTNTLTFTFAGVDADIEGDYTAGINNAIPAQVPKYITVGNGDWDNAATWDTYPVSGGFVPSSGPRGSIAIVNHAVIVDVDGISSYTTTINGPDGKVSTGTTYGHRLGTVTGTGTLACSVGDLPAAEFTEFFKITGGTLEYDGTGNIAILTDLSTINNLKLSGSGTRTLPNIPVQLLGDLTIDGPSVDNDTYDKTISIKGDVTYTAGTFSAGAATWVFNGSAAQAIGGAASFTSTNKFNHFVVNNASGLTLNKPVDIGGDFSLTNGILYSTTTNVVTMTNSSAIINGGGSSSYVDGPIIRNINSGVAYTFPIGSVSRYGQLVLSDGNVGGLWQVEYVNGNPLNNSPSLDPSVMNNVNGTVQYVSHNEYWKVKAPSAATANLTIRWDANSGVNSLTDLKAVQWTDLATDAWTNVAINTPSGTVTSGTVKTSSLLTFNAFVGGNYVTLGSNTIPLFTWLGSSNDWFATANWAGGVLPSAGTNVTIDNQTNDPVISGSTLAQVNNLTMASGATLTLNPGARMTVNGNITNNPGGDIIIRNTVASPTSFMTYGTIANPVSVEWTYPTGRYFYVGHCVDGQTFANYQALADPDPYMFRYPAGAWAEITAAAYSFDTNKLEGYSVKFNGGATQLLTGALRTGSYGPMSINGWHLIGNPYPTYLDLESAGLNRGNALPTIWTTTNATGSAVYATYNINTNVGANGGTRYVAPGQAFWVRNYSASTLSINNTARTHATGVLKASSLVDDVLRVSLSKGVVTDEAVMVFRAIGSDVYSAEYDSEKRLTTGTAEMSLYMLKDNRKLIINALPEDLENRIVPLSITIGSANAGVFKLSATNLVEFMPDMNVYLLDKVTGETINLREKPEYSFTSAAVSAQNRFDLSFAPIDPVVEVPTGTITESTDNVVITAIGLNNKAIVKVIDASFAGEVLIDVLDALGRLHERKVSSTARTEVSAPSNTQFYLVKVTYKDKVQVFKIVTKMD